MCWQNTHHNPDLARCDEDKITLQAGCVFNRLQSKGDAALERLNESLLSLRHPPFRSSLTDLYTD